MMMIARSTHSSLSTSKLKKKRSRIRSVNWYSKMQLTFQEGRKLSYSSMSGIPMVATSPMRHELPPTTTPLNPVEIQGYEPPWKALCDFALNSDLDRPGYNHLVNEVSHFFFFSDPRGAPAGCTRRLIALRAQHNKNPRQCPGTNFFFYSESLFLLE